MAHTNAGAIGACMVCIWIFVSDNWNIWTTGIGMVLIIALFTIHMAKSET